MTSGLQRCGEPAAYRRRFRDRSDAQARGSRMGVDEPEDAAPGVVARLLVTVVSAVEEAVRRVGIDMHLVLDPGLRQSRRELLELLERREVLAGYQQEERRLHGVDAVGHARR